MSSNTKPASSLDRQLLVWLLGPMLAIFAVNTVLGYRVAIHTANEAFDRLLLTSVKAIADRVTVTGDEITVDIPYVALELFESNIRERIFYKVTGPDGATLTGYDDLPAPPHGWSRRDPVFYLSEYHGERLYQAALYKPLYAPAKGMVLVQVGETAESREALSRRILYDDLLPQGLLISFAGVFVALGARRAMLPLRRLRDSIAARPSTDLTPVDERGVQSEVRPLIQALNQHTARIERMIDARVDFVNDAAHQMRTRLAILRTQMEYGQRLEDPAALRDVLESAHEGVTEAGRFFEQLLVLARAEAKAVPGRDTEPVDVAALAYDAAVQWVSAARRKRINLGFEGESSGLVALGSAALLRELLGNIVDNAIHHTQDGGIVTVRVAREGTQAVVRVEDNGPGIPAGERSRVFERFYRAANAAGGGSGLGLAIAAEICRSQQVDIGLADGPGGVGLLVTMRWRLAGAEVTSPGPAASTA